jgi:hypothetical protein
MWYIPAVTKREHAISTPPVEDADTETLALDKEEYDEEAEEGEIRESEGRWKR